MLKKPAANCFSKSKKGFSILEGIISAFVLSVGFVGALNLLSNSIRNSVIDRDRIIAAGLAQEGVEVVRNLRDINYEKGAAAFTGIKSGCVGYWSGSVESCSDFTLRYDGTKFYSLGGSSRTKFSRRITVSGSSPLTVVSKVWWGTGEPSPANCDASHYCVKTQINLTDWKQS